MMRMQLNRLERRVLDAGQVEFVSPPLWRPGDPI